VSQLTNRALTPITARDPSVLSTAASWEDERNCIGMPPMAMFRAAAGRAEGGVRTAFRGSSTPKPAANGITNQQDEEPYPYPSTGAAGLPDDVGPSGATLHRLIAVQCR
ncbi:hypothetical protein THAOC_27999, partial [Thalassiosira oceanica]